MTAKKPAKPKKLSKTKQELRRLREFAQKFMGMESSDLLRIGTTEVNGSIVRCFASYALTGKKIEYLENHEAVAAEVKQLNAMGPDGLMKFLAGKR